MSKYQQSIVGVLADQDMPDECIEHFLEKLPTGMGFAVAVEDGERGTIQIDGSLPEDDPVTLEQFKGVADDYKDTTRIFYFFKFPEKYHTDSQQPFPAIEEEGNTQMVVFMDGNFDKKAASGSKFSPERDVFDKYIKPAIVRIWKGADKEIHQTMEEIATDPGFADMIGMFYEGQASVVLLASNGEMITFGENKDLKEYDWGWATNSLGFGEKSVGEKVVDAVTSAAKRGFGNRKVTGAAATASPTPSAIPRNVASNDKDEEHKYHAPPLNGTKAEKGQWYLDNNEGVIPPGYKTCPKILKMEFRTLKDLKSLGKATDAAVKRPIADVIPVRAPTRGSQIKNARATEASTAAVTTEVLPVIPPPQLKKLAAFMKTDIVAKINNEGRNILDPERFVELEKKHSMFSEVAGLKGLEETFPWLFEAYVKLGSEVGIEALALLAFQLTISYQRFLAAEDGEEINTEEVNDAPPEVKAPKRASGFSNRKVS
jgi:hypothetical protein